MLNGYPEQLKASISKATTAGMSTLNTFVLENDIWILDSGTTVEIYCRTNWLISLKNSVSSVQLPYGSSSNVLKSGDLTFTNSKKITNILYVPEFKLNLMSIAKLTKELSCSVTLLPKFSIMQYLYSGMVLGIRREDGVSLPFQDFYFIHSLTSSLY